MSDFTPNSVSFVFNPKDSRPLPEIIADYAGFPLAYHDVEGERFYAVQDWIAGIAQSHNSRDFWNQMKRRFKKVGIEVSTLCRQLPYIAKNGKRYTMDFADASGLYQITQRMDVKTGLRNAVLKFLADAGVVVDEMRIDPEKAIEAAVAEYRRQGKSDEWIRARLMSTATRNFFTEAFTRSQALPPVAKHYGIITDTMRIGVWKRNTKTIRIQLHLRKQDNVRTHLPTLGLIYEMLAEGASGYELAQRSGLSFSDADAIVRRKSQLVGKQADEMSHDLGVDLITNQPLLTDSDHHTVTNG